MILRSETSKRGTPMLHDCSAQKRQNRAMATRSGTLFDRRCIGLILVAACATPCFAQTKPSPNDLERTLSLRVPTGRVDGNFVECLGQIAHAFNVPMGIAWLKTTSSQQTRSIKYSDTTVLEIIETIAST